MSAAHKNSWRLKAALVVASAALSVQAAGHDLGVQGKMWNITEIDMRVLVLQSALRANIAEVQDQMKQSAESYMDRLPKRSLQLPEKTDTRWIDPSIELAGDIQTVSTDENTNQFRWSTLFRKGTRVNPLAAFKPVTALLYFNGASDEQVEFVKHILQQDVYGRVVLLESTGSRINELNKMLGRPVFYASDAQVRQFNVTKVPALLFPGSAEHEGLLGLKEMAPPFKVEEIEMVWRLDVKKVSGPFSGAKK